MDSALKFRSHYAIELDLRRVSAALVWRSSVNQVYFFEYSESSHNCSDCVISLGLSYFFLSVIQEIRTSGVEFRRYDFVGGVLSHTLALFGGSTPLNRIREPVLHN